MILDHFDIFFLINQVNNHKALGTPGIFANWTENRYSKKQELNAYELLLIKFSVYEIKGKRNEKSHKPKN